MLYIFGSSIVFVCDKDFSIIQNGGIAFEGGVDRILKVGDYKELKALYPQAQAHFYDNAILLPALINAHIHFEFGTHVAQFCYGDFGKWLDSLIDNRDNVLSQNIQSIIESDIKEQYDSGVGSVGAISSYGNDMLPLAKSALRVVYFNEAIGSNPSAIDVLYANIIDRLHNAQTLSSHTFTPALALHSPYSLHPIMAQKLIELVTKNNMPISAHFLESKQEREWLMYNSGYFESFFKRFSNIDKPSKFYTPTSFLQMFCHIKNSPISFTHCLYATQEEIDMIENLNASIITCPRSNRLLNNTFLDRSMLQNTSIPIALGTDGKSSNNNVNILDEMRVALYAYSQEEVLTLAKTLILNATIYGAKALGLNNGTLSEGKSVDFAIFDFAQALYDPKQVHPNQSPLHFILHAKKASKLYINAKAVL